MTPFQWNEGGTDEAGTTASAFAFTEDDNGDASWGSVSSGSGDYPDHKIDDADRSWNLNMSIALGFIFYFPLKPSVGE